MGDDRAALTALLDLFMISLMDVLRMLDQEIADRCAATVAAHADWPCRRGCDHCCRHLAAEPALTAAEWERLEPMLTEEMIERAVRLAGPPYICPFLDPGSGACGVYEARPVACRTYGFYVERDLGLYCPDIRQRVERGEFGEVVWGNQSGVDRRLRVLGERRLLRDWLSGRASSDRCCVSQTGRDAP